MGWYESPKAPGVMLGDEAFDAMYAGLAGVTAAYREGLGRKPTLDELRALLEIELSVAGADLVDGLDDKAIKDVAIKTANKPKKQPYAVGDVFAIPISGGRFAFGRVMSEDKQGGMLAEVFAKTADAKAFNRDIVASGRMFPPIQMTRGNGIEDWRWTVVRSDPGYERPKEKLEWVSPHPAGGGWAAVDEAGNLVRSVSADEAKAMISGKLWRPPNVEKEIDERLAAGPAKKR